MENSLYPLKFKPILKDKIWGGQKLSKLYGKESNSSNLGESWELSGYEGDESVVTNGFLAENSLTELIEIYMGDLVGDKVYERFGLSFPLLFKLIDANENLSIQVHPNDETAHERHESLGKTEMWYVLDADQGSEMIVGFKNDCSQDEYLDALENGQVESLLQSIPVKKGDVLFIPAGLVHAIGKGIVVAEIQESSDITYRIFDFNRKDEHGNERELHTEDALGVINFAAHPEPFTAYQDKMNTINELVSCQYFTTNLLKIDQPLTRNFGTIDSFVSYMCVEGSLVIESEGTEKVVVNKGDTVLIPNALNEVGLIPEKTATLLEVHL